MHILHTHTHTHKHYKHTDTGVGFDDCTSSLRRRLPEGWRLTAMLWQVRGDHYDIVSLTVGRPALRCRASSSLAARARASIKSSCSCWLILHTEGRKNGLVTSLTKTALERCRTNTKGHNKRDLNHLVCSLLVWPACHWISPSLISKPVLCLESQSVCQPVHSPIYHPGNKYGNQTSPAWASNRKMCAINRWSWITHKVCTTTENLPWCALILSSAHGCLHGVANGLFLCLNIQQITQSALTIITQYTTPPPLSKHQTDHSQH